MSDFLKHAIIHACASRTHVGDRVAVWDLLLPSLGSWGRCQRERQHLVPAPCALQPSRSAVNEVPCCYLKPRGPCSSYRTQTLWGAKRSSVWMGLSWAVLLVLSVPLIKQMRTGKILSISFWECSSLQKESHISGNFPLIFICITRTPSVCHRPGQGILPFCFLFCLLLL